MALFYGWGSTASRLEPLRGSSLLFTANDRTYYLNPYLQYYSWRFLTYESFSYYELETCSKLLGEQDC